MFPIILEEVLDPAVVLGDPGYPQYIQVPDPLNPTVLVDAVGPAKPGLLDSIESSLRIILAWTINVRFFLPQFGSILDTLLGYPNATDAKTAVNIFVTKAITTWEQRIDVTSVSVVQDGEYLEIDIAAVVRETQTKFNYQITV